MARWLLPILLAVPWAIGEAAWAKPAIVIATQSDRAKLPTAQPLTAEPFMADSSAIDSSAIDPPVELLPVELLPVAPPAIAQAQLPPIRPEIDRQTLPEQPLPDQPLPPLPPPEELLPTPAPIAPPAESLPGVPDRVYVERFEVVGSTVFSPEELAAVTAPFSQRDLSFAELLQARSAVTQLYIDNGYITSGALIPPQTLENGVVTIQVIEGSLEEINVTGTRRLNPSYVRSRLRLVSETPLNVPRLLEGLQLLQLDPLIENLSADLQAGVRTGTSILQVQVSEADSFSVTLDANNNRSPSVGSFRRGITISEGNLWGLGDGLSLSYANTDGSDQLDASYTIPFNPRNGTLRLAYGTTDSNVIEEPFNELDILANSTYAEVSIRQPLFQSPSEELAIGLTGSYQSSQTELGLLDVDGEPIGPFPLSPGADEDGRTRVTALRFFQEWTRRSSREVLAARSQFSLGLDALDSTINAGDTPDSRFFAWRGQGQWVRLLAPDTLLLVRGDVQLSPDPLLSLEQFGLGGGQSVRGYRQDALLTDSGALLSAEVRLPIVRIREVDGLLSVIPFFDLGYGWNNVSPDPDPNTLLGTGVGLSLRLGETLNARIDWGIPLIEVDDNDRTWQENGIYFSIQVTPF